ncbi:Modification methylase DpnIIB [Anatilimnocola aggregata]|uniref:site-specific DNA-methyltransferase (adenine-specific) n=1 Tax=Anatilimnocola aggregata TaxID=2528021 RepID=A0A517Y6M6_9BACT|nr:site-specific DNA-methyltransferase [Anatilimnocola aggregata]QDU25894.1 Modification methylase DpnIIB [Anatilimnocola aggregata]
MAKKAKSKSVAAAADSAVEVIKHKQDRRKNIPTEELRDFYQDEPRAMLYPRDPSLDPQLVWKGKDEQDRGALEVPVVPIYIQEKIHPQVIVDDLKNRFAVKPAQQQLDLFADFNGIDTFEKKVEFYQHDAHWTNRMILGNSLHVMTSLAEKEGLKGQVQCIYMDPPYGIKFGSNWQVSTRKRDVKDGKAEDASRQPEQVQAFRDTWQLGIHSYLPYLRDRLIVARDLLTESGSVFVQIGDENVHLVRAVMDEVFGTENQCAQLAFKKTSVSTSGVIPGVVDYILWFAKDKSNVKVRQVWISKELGGEGAAQYSSIELPDGQRRRMTSSEVKGDGQLPVMSRPFRGDNLTSSHEYSLGKGDYVFEGRSFSPNARYWSTSPDGLKRLASANRLIAIGNTLSYVRFLDDFPVFPLTNTWTDTAVSGFAEARAYVVQTSPLVIARCLLMTTDPGDLVLDPTCGSGTTAYVAEQWGRRWITCDTSRVAIALARTRLMAGRFPYYLLSDSPEGLKKEAEVTGRFPPPYQTEADVKKGFVYKRVPHVTLKSIANNEAIDVIHARWQEELETLRAELNKILKTKWEEWEIPREPEEKWPATAKKKLADWWTNLRSRQQDIDAAIAKRADHELLFDQPYEDNSRVRVTGPFTVESLSPHRRLTVQEKIEGTKFVPGFKTQIIGPDRFGTMIIENLKKAGIQAREKRERLKFDHLEPYAGEWIHAAGDFTDADGKQKRVAVCIGPEHGTVGPELIKEAAKEAVRGVGFDLLYVCGFSFDPHVNEEAKRYGKLNVQICRMNPDLSMGDELLKKTGAGNLFMVFGEPDIAIKRTKDKKSGDERVVVEIHGVDVYDPTTGVIRNSSTDDIACWFIDTDYDDEAFFVRHAYFTGAGEPYEKLKRALRAEIDESAWASLYSTRSQPFPVPAKKGKIAVKVINHYGDEVLKVYSVK